MHPNCLQKLFLSLQCKRPTGGEVITEEKHYENGTIKRERAEWLDDVLTKYNTDQAILDVAGAGLI